MILLNSPLEMRRGKVYNLVFKGVGAGIRGYRTILVVSKRPFKYVELFHQYGDPQTSDIRSDVTEVTRRIETEFILENIFEPHSEREWFKHSMVVKSLDEGIKRKVLTRTAIKKHPVGPRSTYRPLQVVTAGKKHRIVGVYTLFHVEGKTSQSKLQTVFVWWDSWEKLRDDFKRYGVKVFQPKN